MERHFGEVMGDKKEGGGKLKKISSVFLCHKKRYEESGGSHGVCK